MTTFRVMKVRGVLPTVVIIGSLVLAACSSTPDRPIPAGHPKNGHPATTTSAATSSTAVSSTTTSNAAGPQCSFGDLTASFGSPNGAAGHTYYALNFLNTGTVPCTLYGYPGVSFLNANQSTIGSATSREGNESSAVVILKPGGIAVATLAVTDPGIPPCSNSATPSYVWVYPPGSFSAYLIPITGVSVCSSLSTGNYQDSFVAPVQLAGSSNEGAGPYSACDLLDISIGQSDAGLGHIGEPILFHNAGTTICTMYGYPSVTASSDGTTSGVTYTLNGYLGGTSGSTIPMVSLAPGATASALVEGTDNPEGSATSCPTYSSMEITPPSDSQMVTLDASLPGCSVIEVHPVVSGSTGSQS